MVDQVNDILDRLIAAGSPGLAAEIANQRSQYNGLQNFADMTFKQMLTAVGVPLGPQPIFADGFESDAAAALSVVHQALRTAGQ